MVKHRDANGVKRSEIPLETAMQMIVELNTTTRIAKDPKKKIFAFTEDYVINIFGMKYFFWKDEYLVF
jgi:hypothetical protein